MFRDLTKFVVTRALETIFTNAPNGVKMVESEVEISPYKGTNIGFGCQLKK